MKRLFQIILTILFSYLLIAIMGVTQIHASTNGVMLDNARMYNSPLVIKRYMRVIKNHGGQYLQLHLTDDSNFGLENQYLKQTPQLNSYQKQGVWYSKITKAPYLTKMQLKNLYQYADKLNLKLVLEIDVPGHSQALLKLLKHKGYSNYSQIAYGNELDYGQKRTSQLVLKLLSEYRHIIPKHSTLALGGDEFSGGSISDQKDYRKFVNRLDTYLQHWGYRLQLYNDGFYKSQLQYYHKDILIDYWSLDGQQDLLKTRQININRRATLPQLIKSGFSVINNNAEYTYIIVDKDGTTNQDDLTKLLSIWNPRLWDATTNQLGSLNIHNYGNMLSIWGESHTKVNPIKLQHQVSNSIEQFLQKAITD